MDVKLDAVDRQTFLRVAEVLFAPMTGPDALAAMGPSTLQMEARIDALVAGFPSDVDRLALKVLLGLLRTRAGGLLLFGRPEAFVKLSSTEAERIFLGLLTSSSSTTRQGAKLLRQMIGLLLAHPLPARDAEGARDSPLWKAIGYPGPLGSPPSTEPRVVATKVESGATWTCDVVVIGSGAGGGVAASVLAAAGLDVVILERGALKTERDFTHYQDEADRDLYEIRPTSDLGVTVVNGRCVGGGTVVNYATSLATPLEVRAEWDREAGFRGVFAGRGFADSLDAVQQRLGVNDRQSTPWARDRLIAEAGEKLGWDVGVLPRNVRGCLEDAQCGFCNFGCRAGAKQSTLRTWVEDALAAGARLVVDCEAEQVIQEEGRAVAVRARVGQKGETPRALTVFARAIVVSCGALHTPLLLERSGIALPALGRNLHLHPVTGVWGLFPNENTDPWGGVMQARIGRHLSNLDGRGYGVRFESGAVHPAEFTVMQGWGGAHDFKEVLRNYRHWVPFAVLLRDHSGGRVHAPRIGPSRIDYALEAVDQRHVREGVRHAAMGLREVGAIEVRTVTSRPVVWRPGGGETLEQFMSRVDGIGYGANQHTYGSYHPNGTARMGASPKTSVCDETNQVHGVPGLYVMDASCFPTASGVNPMITIEAIAHRAATGLANAIGRYG